MRNTPERSGICAVHLQGRRVNDRAARVIAILWLLLLAGVVFAQPAESELGHQLNPVKEPVPAPDFTLRDMDDRAYSIRDLRGSVVMLNFWATWCPPCRHEMPSLEALYRKFSGEAFTVIGINEWEDPDLVFAYMGDLSVFPTFPIVYDRDGDVSVAYGVKGLPTTYLLNRNGDIVYRAVGGRNFDHPEVEKTIRALLEERN